MSGKASRRVQKRQPGPAQGTAAARGRRRLWIGIGAAAIVAVAVAGGIVALTQSGNSSAAPFSDEAAADRSAPAALGAAADAVGFHPTADPGTGLIESRPASAAQPPRSPILIDTGTPAPDFELKTPQGESVRLGSLQGRTVLLEFFTTWCGLCNTEAPHLKRLAASLPAGRFAVVTINADAEDAASVFAFHRFYGFPFPSLLDPSQQPGSFNRPGVPGPVSQQYGMKSLPTFYVIDRKGTITWRSDGEQPDAKLRQELERADRS